MTILFDDGGSVNTEDGICRGRRDSSEDYHEGEGRCKSPIASHGPMTRMIWMRDTIVHNLACTQYNTNIIGECNDFVSGTSSSRGVSYESR